jgi:hypothetical protein
MFIISVNIFEYAYGAVESRTPLKVFGSEFTATLSSWAAAGTGRLGIAHMRTRMLKERAAAG